MKKLFRFIGWILILTFLTALTQVGGIIFLFSLTTYQLINKKVQGYWLRILAKSVSFLLLYLIFLFVIVPISAKPLGRVPLPMLEGNHVRPGNIGTYFLMRNYVRPELRETLYRTASKMNAQYPGTVINYLDAGFPYIDGFPLPPHLSHNDGKKLDLAFFYLVKESNPTSRIPSPIGYGVSEVPKPGEADTPDYCNRMGAWQYSVLFELFGRYGKGFKFDEGRTKSIVNFFAEENSIGRMYLEPHLKTRLGLTSDKIRFHGCKAVRHDDHLHIQIL